jgi:hypothetical protein
MKKSNWLMICIGLSLLSALLACNLTPSGSTPNNNPTEAAIATSIAANATLAAQLGATLQVEPAQPTATQAPIATKPAQTAAPAAQCTALSADQSATQTALQPILGELSLYGIEPQPGKLGWIQPPLSLEVDQYLGTKFDTKFPLTVAKDFVLSSDITWNTEYGGSGCGFVFRSDGKKDAPSQYLVATSRLADGHVFFAVMSQGELVVGKDFYANGIDPKFDASNGATNHLAVVAQGNTFTIYSNGTKLGQADPTAPLPPLDLPKPPAKPANLSDPVANAQYQSALADYRALVTRLKAEYEKRLGLWRKLDKVFERGFVSLGVVAQSGRTQCDFNNAWLWLLGEE